MPAKGGSDPIDQLIDLVWSLLSPTSFRNVVDAAGDQLKVIMGALSALSSTDLRHPSGITPADALNAIHILKGAKKGTSTLRAEMLLAGQPVYDMMGELIEAEHARQLERCVEICRKILTLIDRGICPRIYSQINATLGAKICVLSADNNSYSVEEAAPYLETALEYGPRDEHYVLATAHMNLAQILSVPSWDDPASRQARATDHAEQALKAAKAGNNNHVLLTAHSFLMEAYRNKAAAHFMERNKTDGTAAIRKARSHCNSLIALSELAGNTDDRKIFINNKKVLNNILKEARALP
jgi:hypothetical protein